MTADQALKMGMVSVGDWVAAGDDCAYHVGDRIILTHGYRATVVMHEGYYYYKVTHRPFYDRGKQQALTQYLKSRGIHKAKWKITTVTWLIFGIVIGCAFTIWTLIR